MSLENQFISYEQALELKELGFDEPCFGIYYGSNDLKLFNDCKWEERTNSKFLIFFEDRDEFCTAVTWQQCWGWFLVKYNLNAYISYSKSYDWQFIIDDIVLDDVVKEVLYFKTKEEAMLNCLDELIEIAEQFKKK